MNPHSVPLLHPTRSRISPRGGPLAKALLLPLFMAATLHAGTDVEFIRDFGTLQPSSTFELRFARPMVGAEEIGAVVPESPLVITPPLSGSFTWLSRRSGVFVPSAPPALGTEYLLTTRPGLRDAGEKPVGKGFREIVRTPEFGVSASVSGVYEADNAPAIPESKIGFNLAVSLENAPDFFVYRNDAGVGIPAAVRHATFEDYFQMPIEAEDWLERWNSAHNPAAASGPDSDEEEMDDDTNERTQPRPNRLVVTPVRPLTTGSLWRLEMKPGIRARDLPVTVAAPLTLALGRVRPFQLEKLTASSYIQSGRSLTMTFSKALAPDITEDNAGRFIRITPPVEGLAFEGGWSSFTVRGAFELGKEYRVTLSDEVVSANGLPLEGDRTRPITFAPAKPRVYLPAITAHQLRGGRREFQVLSANLSSLKITARRADPANLSATLAAFEKSYAREPDYTTEDIEPYQPVPTETIGGEVLAECRVNLSPAPLDVRQDTVLKWNEFVPPDTAGAVFLTVEGTPLPEIGGRTPGAQAFVQLTDLGVLWKAAGQDLIVRAFSMSTGKPLAGVSLRLTGGDGSTVREARTDDEGQATLKADFEPQWLVATLGMDTHALRMGPQAPSLPTAAFGIPTRYHEWGASPASSEPLRCLIFSDRPLYRPNESVHVKGIVRRAGSAGLSLPGELNAVLVLSDPRGMEIHKQPVTLGAGGSFDTQLTPDSPKMGRFNLRLEFPGYQGDTWGAGFSCAFEIAQYQPDPFEIKIAAASRLVPAQALTASVTGSYYFGGPVADAQVAWTLQMRSVPFAPEGYPGFVFGSTDEEDRKPFTLSGRGELEGKNPFEVTPEIPDPESGPQAGTLTVDVTDPNGQTVTQSHEFLRDSSPVYLGIASPERVVRTAGESLSVQTIAVSASGQPVSEIMDVDVELVRIVHRAVRVKGAGNAIGFRNESTEEPVARAKGGTLPLRRDGEQWVASGGETASVVPPRAGPYVLRASMPGPKGGPRIMTETSIFVSGRDETAWDYRTPSQVDLVPDKSSYAPGETARVLVKSPMAGDAWFTIERGDAILRSWHQPLEGNAPVIEIPVQGTDAPNLVVSMVLLRGAQQSTRAVPQPDYRYGMCSLRVVDSATKLEVTIRPTSDDVRPGDTVAAEILVRDGNGKPTPDAEVTFWAADDGVLSITGYERPMPWDDFSAPIPLRTRLGLTLMDLLPEAVEDRRFSNKGYLIGGGGREGPGAKIRTDFPGTACWMPSLRTDSAGVLRVTFRAPDALTRYRLLAVAHTGIASFGSAESAVRISKPLLILPSVPMFANEGDEWQARAIVRNDTGHDAQVAVALELDATAKHQGPPSQAITVPAGQSLPLMFPVQLVKTGAARWVWSATVAGSGGGPPALEDRVETTLNVQSPALILREVYVSELQDASNNLLEGVNPQILEGSGTGTVSLTNHRLGTVREAVTRLLDYPYGCAEQTTSRLVPWLVLPDLRPAIAGSDLEKKLADSERNIREGIRTLFSMQTPSGGLGFWPGASRPSLFASAYAAAVLSRASAQEISLPPGWDKLLDYLAEELRGLDKSKSEAALEDKVLAALALAWNGRTQESYLEELFRRRASLPMESRALLALAICAGGPSDERVADLLDTKKSAPEAGPHFGGAARELAARLLAWQAFQPRNKETARLAAELNRARANGHWGTTQQDAWALLAFAQLVRDSGPAKPVSGEVVVKDKPTAFLLDAKVRSFEMPFALDPADGPAELLVRNPRKLPLFGEAAFEIVPPATQQPAQNRGFAVSRSYQALESDGSLRAPGEPFRVGDRVLVTVRVETPRTSHFVAINDPLPSLFEAVNPAFKSRGGDSSPGRDGVADHREMRADRVLFFCDHLPPGAHVFRYLARVRTAGSASAPASKAEEMYRPERFGLGTIETLITRE